jgi:hypothetical protein
MGLARQFIQSMLTHVEMAVPENAGPALALIGRFRTYEFNDDIVRAVYAALVVKFGEELARYAPQMSGVQFEWRGGK